MRLPFLDKFLNPPIKLYWWRLNEGRPGEPGNFGDEITKEIIENVFHRKVEWSEFENCQIIGAGSILDEVTPNKGNNRPFLWGSGFIKAGELTISEDDYKILAVRGKESQKRIKNPPKNLVLGDPGLLASYLVKKIPKKKYIIGIVPHYVDISNPFVSSLAKNLNVLLIDPTWPATDVAEAIAACDTILSSSMHGLIVADSLNVPNVHLKLSNQLTGGSYKFNDYYSIYNQPRYHQIAPDILAGFSPEQIKQYVLEHYSPIPKEEIDQVKKDLVKAFPF